MWKGDPTRGSSEEELARARATKVRRVAGHTVDQCDGTAWPSANNRVEASHQPTRQRERQMRGFTSRDHAQRFLHVHGTIQNLFRVGRHQLRAVHHRILPARALATWTAVTAG